jgi:hypothetical protein
MARPMWRALACVVEYDHFVSDDLTAAERLAQLGFLKDIEQRGNRYHANMTGAGLQAWEQHYLSKWRRRLLLGL